MQFKKKFILYICLYAIISGADKENKLDKLKKMDANGDGTISREEFRGNNEQFSKTDHNQDGKLDAADFTAGKKGAKNKGGIDYSAMFIQMDKNNDQKLSADEFTGKPEMFTKLDIDSSGFITVDELDSIKKKFLQGRDEDKKEILPDTIELKSGIVFKKIGSRELALDIYRQKGLVFKKSPALVFIHGGGFKSGSRLKVYTGKEAILKPLLQKGIQFVSIDYRLTSDGTSTLLECTTDCLDALRYLVKNSPALGIDPGKIAVWGSSAGGHLALMCALASDRFAGDDDFKKTAFKVKCCVDWFGPVDFTDFSVWAGRNKEDVETEEGQIALFGKTLSEDKNLFTSLSPISYISRKNPPVLLIHGDKDNVVPCEHSRKYYAAAKKSRAKAEYIEVKNSGHGFKAFNAEISPSAADLNKKTLDFLLRHLK